MSEGKAYDLGRFQRVVGYESKWITGKFLVLGGFSARREEQWVTAIEVTIWDDLKIHGRVLYSNDLTAKVTDGKAEIHEHQIASNKLADVQDVWGEMELAITAVAQAAIFDQAEAEGK